MERSGKKASWVSVLLLLLLFPLRGEKGRKTRILWLAAIGLRGRSGRIGLALEENVAKRRIAKVADRPPKMWHRIMSTISFVAMAAAIFVFPFSRCVYDWLMSRAARNHDPLFENGSAERSQFLVSSERRSTSL